MNPRRFPGERLIMLLGSSGAMEGTFGLPPTRVPRQQSQHEQGEADPNDAHRPMKDQVLTNLVPSFTNSGDLAHVAAARPS